MPLWLWLIIMLAALLAVAAVLRFYLLRLVDRRIALYQNDLVARHLAEVQNIYHEMRGWRHDYHNHIQSIKAYRKFNENEKLDSYLNQLEQDLAGVDQLIKSGNIMTDAILNSKLSLAKSRDIRIDASAVVPEKLSVSEIDLCVLIGNLLDNAMEATMQLADRTARQIRVYIDVKQSHLYLSVTNTAEGRAFKQNGRYISAKAGSHGFGLARVDRLVNKYGGYLKRRDEEGAFTTEVLLPL